MSTEDIFARINRLNDQIEAFARQKTAAMSERDRHLVETLALVETVRMNRLPPAEICGRLRAAAMTAREFSPFITANMEIIADHFDRLRH